MVTPAAGKKETGPQKKFLNFSRSQLPFRVIGSKIAGVISVRVSPGVETHLNRAGNEKLRTAETGTPEPLGINVSFRAPLVRGDRWPDHRTRPEFPIVPHIVRTHEAPIDMKSDILLPPRHGAVSPAIIEPPHFYFCRPFAITSGWCSLPLLDN